MCKTHLLKACQPGPPPPAEAPTSTTQAPPARGQPETVSPTLPGPTAATSTPQAAVQTPDPITARLMQPDAAGQGTQVAGGESDNEDDIEDADLNEYLLAGIPPTPVLFKSDMVKSRLANGGGIRALTDGRNVDQGDKPFTLEETVYLAAVMNLFLSDDLAFQGTHTRASDYQNFAATLASGNLLWPYRSSKCVSNKVKRMSKATGASVQIYI